MESIITNFFVMATIITANQVLTNAADIVRLDPVCSRNGAGVHWEITSSNLGALHRLNLEYSCTTTSGEVLTHDEDDCFHKNGRIRALPQLSENMRSMFHAVTAELELGTVCVFYSRGVDNFFRPRTLEEDTVNCTVKESSIVLPAVCTFNSTCDCQCSPGTELVPGTDILDGIICTPAPSSHTVTSSYTSTTLEDSILPTSIKVNTTVIEPSSSVTSADVLRTTHKIPDDLDSMSVGITSTNSQATTTSFVSTSSPSYSLAYIAFSVPVLGVLFIAFSFFVIWEYRRQKHKRYQDKMAKTFKELGTPDIMGESIKENLEVGYKRKAVDNDYINESFASESSLDDNEVKNAKNE